MKRGSARSKLRRLTVRDLARKQCGVASRRQLSALGISYDDIRSEVTAGRWAAESRQTIRIGELADGADRWRALFDVGPAARLDGVSALVLAGLQNWSHDEVDVVVPHGSSFRRPDGVRIFVERHLEPATDCSTPASAPSYALVRAAMSSASDRQAATLIAMAVQQRVVAADELLRVWGEWSLPRRRTALHPLIRDVCAGAESLGELDFAGLCRERGLPEPERQKVHEGTDGRVFLDCRWRCGLVVEIDGSQHFAGVAPVDDALRQNAVVLTSDTVLRMPVLGLRLKPIEFMDQIESALRKLGELVA